MTTLYVAGRDHRIVPVAEYVVDTDDLDPTLSPRPYLHPVRTLSGTVVTAAQPADHPWHLGFSVAIPDVDGTNFWGGPTYRAEDGYQYRGDHGRVVHRRWLRQEDHQVEHELEWISASGEVLLAERRKLYASSNDGMWHLTMTTTLVNVTDRTIDLRSPGTAGRAGAGYGGLFWRMPPGVPELHGPDELGEEELNGARSGGWIIARTDAYRLTFRTDDVDNWFVRAAEYPAVGTSFAWQVLNVLRPSVPYRRNLGVTIEDGEDSAQPAYVAAKQPLRRNAAMHNPTAPAEALSPAAQPTAPGRGR